TRRGSESSRRQFMRESIYEGNVLPTDCFRARARPLHRDFVVLIVGTVRLRQQIPELSGFSAIQTRLTFANNLDDPDPRKRECDRVCSLVAQAVISFRGIAVTQEICPVRT